MHFDPIHVNLARVDAASVNPMPQGNVFVAAAPATRIILGSPQDGVNHGACVNTQRFKSDADDCFRSQQSLTAEGESVKLKKVQIFFFIQFYWKTRKKRI